MDKDAAARIERARRALNESELLRERLRVLDEALAATPVAESVTGPAAGEPAPDEAPPSVEGEQFAPPVPQRF